MARLGPKPPASSQARGEIERGAPCCFELAAVGSKAKCGVFDPILPYPVGEITGARRSSGRSMSQSKKGWKIRRKH